MSPKFDDAAYDEGRKMFRKGRTLRSILEPIIDAEEARDNRERAAKPTQQLDYAAERAEREAATNRDFSRAVGFADEFIASLRSR